MNPNVDMVRITHLEHDNHHLREVVRFILDFAEGSTAVNTLPNIARIARSALSQASRITQHCSIQATYIERTNETDDHCPLPRRYDGPATSNRTSARESTAHQGNRGTRHIAALASGSLGAIDPGAFGWWMHHRHDKGIDIVAISCAHAMMSFNL